MVSQETFLFSDTLTNNIAYGLESIDEKVLNEVSEISQIKKDIDTFSEGYNTILGERGITLIRGTKTKNKYCKSTCCKSQRYLSLMIHFQQLIQILKKKY